MHDSTDMAVDRLTPERRRALTRNALIDAAAEVFAKRGFHAASLDEIAEVAGFTRGAIYSNFGGKEDLLIAVLELFTERQLDAFGAALDPARGVKPQERTAAAASVWGATQRETHLAALALEMRVYALRNPDFRRRLAETEARQQQRIATFIEETAAAEGTTLPMPSTDLAQMLRAFSDGLSQLAALDDERSEYYDTIAARFFELIEKAMTAEEGGPTSPAKKRRS
jgi:AcrR family transcriptional regulator